MKVSHLIGFLGGGHPGKVNFGHWSFFSFLQSASMTGFRSSFLQMDKRVISLFGRFNCPGADFATRLFAALVVKPNAGYFLDTSLRDLWKVPKLLFIINWNFLRSNWGFCSTNWRAVVLFVWKLCWIMIFNYESCGLLWFMIWSTFYFQICEKRRFLLFECGFLVISIFGVPRIKIILKKNFVKNVYKTTYWTFLSNLWQIRSDYFPLVSYLCLDNIFAILLLGSKYISLCLRYYCIIRYDWVGLCLSLVAIEPEDYLAFDFKCLLWNKKTGPFSL